MRLIFKETFRLNKIKKTNMGSANSTEESEKDRIKQKIDESRRKRIQDVIDGKYRENGAHCCEEDHHEETEEDMDFDVTKYDFPFENLVFEGGGNKGMAYCGCIKVLEDAGIMRKIKRVAGTSVGSLAATMVAIGYTYEELKKEYRIDLTDLIYEGSYWSIIPNIFKAFGWNPGNKIFDWMGEIISVKAGNPDITFLEIYKKFGRELCIVVTNLNQMKEVYCHPKTTPHMPVRSAVRMSMSIPGLFQAFTFNMFNETDTFVDGGVICNFPLHCFDGWWLSLKPGDSFVERLQPLKDIQKLSSDSERFAEHNEKTLGFVVYSNSELDTYRYTLSSRPGAEKPSELPDTTLSRERKEPTELKENLERENECISKAVNCFLKALGQSNNDGDHSISMAELKNALTQGDFTEECKVVLFGEDVSVEEIMQVLDLDSDGKIQYSELVQFIEQTGISIQQKFTGFKRFNISGILSFANGVYTAITTNLLRVFAKAKDIERTVGINTSYIQTTDFKLEEADKEFIIKRGENATLAYLRSYVEAKNL